MTRVALSGGYYVARNIIAAVQRCLNLMQEPNPPDSPVPFTDYPTPGSVTLATYTGGGFRCLYTATNGDLFGVCGQKVFFIASDWSATLLGTLTTINTNMVVIADNGTSAIVVDGSSLGYQIDLATHAWAPITEPAFYGANWVDFLSTYFLLNKPGTGEFYTSDSNAVTFDPLFFGTKITYADPLGALKVLNQEIWLIGSQESTEVWVLAGGPDFPFQELPSVLINHGIVATYSLAKIGVALFWLSRDLNGQAIVLKGENYQSIRISTFAIETALAGYSVISDAVGYTYQQAGHEFYVLTFPTADKTWVYDVQLNLWHERCWLDTNGVEHRVRGSCMAFAYGVNVAGDWETATLRQLTTTLDTDDGVGMKFLRSFPHMVSDGDRVIYSQFIADMAVGTGTGAPLVSLRWSDTKGASWGNPITGSMGAVGEYLTQIQFQRLGMARDRVFEVSWSGNGGQNALNGAFITFKPSGT